MAVRFHDFMAEALYGPQGYYSQGRNFLGSPPRDFTTAPELTPLFGACLGNWVAAQWQKLGAPAHFALIEMGPGRGSLMRGLLTHLQVAHAPCYAALVRVELVEVSPVLTKLQQELLKDFGQCTWSSALPTDTYLLPTLCIANELIDALPAQPYRLTAAGWEELWVEDAALIWRACPAPPLPHGWQPAVGAEFDHLPTLPALLADIHAVAKVALLIDYGAASLPANAKSTIQAVQRHQKVQLLHEPGATDLTVQVNFAEVQQLLGTRQNTLQPLADFLLANGLADLALPLLATQSPHPGTESALHRLLHPGQMGTLHQALCSTRSTP
jgi:SAM-dependent MidA family methyltransferase